MATEDGLTLSGSKVIPRTELTYRASRAGGAGGQHVNTSSTRIELLWNLRSSSVIGPEELARLEVKLASWIDSDGWIRIVSSERRSQLQNREAADERLVELIRAALVVAKKRRPTKPTKGSREARLSGKKKRGETKRQRRGADD